MIGEKNNNNILTLPQKKVLFSKKSVRDFVSDSPLANEKVIQLPQAILHVCLIYFKPPRQGCLCATLLYSYHHLIIENDSIVLGNFAFLPQYF